MRALNRKRIAALALVTCITVGCAEHQRDPSDQSSMAAGSPAVRAMSANSIGHTDRLTGRTYLIEVRKRGAAEVQVDTLTFSEESFVVSGLAQRGFGPASFRGVRDNVGEAFTAIAKSQSEGEMEWSGMLVKGRLDGRFVHKRRGEQPVEYEYRGYPVE